MINNIAEIKESQQGTLLIYGATGYTGTMVCDEAARRGIRFEIAGRSEDKLAALSAKLHVPYHVFGVEDTAGWETALQGKAVLLNIAGPFSETAERAMDACIKFKVHYLDIAAEVDIYRLAESKDEAAKAAGIMLLSGAGLFVVYDPLVLRTIKRVESPMALRVAFKYAGGFTPGSIASSSNIVNAGILVRKDGKIEKLSQAPSATFDFGTGPEECFPTPIGGVILCYKSTGIPDIEEYFQMALPAASGEMATVGRHNDSGAATADGERSKILVEVTGKDGEIMRSMVNMSAGYIPTVTSSVEVVSRVLNGSHLVGFQSPASAYGDKLLDALVDIRVTDF